MTSHSKEDFFAEPDSAVDVRFDELLESSIEISDRNSNETPKKESLKKEVRND